MITGASAESITEDAMETAEYWLQFLPELPPVLCFSSSCVCSVPEVAEVFLLMP